MCIKTIQHYCIMRKMGGRICDSCRTMFYSGDPVVELCEKCANTVWCVIYEYDDGSRELSSIHHTEEKAKKFCERLKESIAFANTYSTKKITKHYISEWAVL